MNVTIGGLVSNGLNFTVANAGPPPTLTAVSPNVGSVQGGQQTTVTGTTVKIGNKPASVLTLVSATSMIVQVQVSGVRTGTGTGGAGASPQGAIEVSLPEASKMMPIGDQSRLTARRRGSYQSTDSHGGETLVRHAQIR